MSVTASGRYDVSLAPSGLALVQELLNTRSAGRPRRPDLLDDLSSARTWLDSAIEMWCARTGTSAVRVHLDEPDLPTLQALRTHLTTTIGRRTSTADGAGSPDTGRASGEEPGIGTPPELQGTLRLSFDTEGRLCVAPAGEGAQWLASAVLGEIQVALLADTWRRLKLCRNGKCSGAFYDRSRNNSGVWHDVHVCGNAANLRASRARRRAALEAAAIEVAAAAPSGE